jgi:hypothetical protein
MTKLIKHKEKEIISWLPKQMIKGHFYKSRLRLAYLPSEPEDSEARSTDLGRGNVGNYR